MDKTKKVRVVVSIDEAIYMKFKENLELYQCPKGTTSNIVENVFIFVNKVLR